MAGLLRVERDGPFARVTLARPEVRNAFNAELIAELDDVFRRLATEAPDRLRGVVMAGEGSTFCAGADIAWMQAAASLTREENERDASALRTMLTAIDTCPVPVIVRVHGAALGGGMGLCAVGDVVLATADARFGFTETTLGLLPAVIGPFVVAKIGETHARALFPSGLRFAAPRAATIGLVHEVLEDEPTLDRRVEELLDGLRAAGPVAVREAKRLVRDLRGLPAAEAAELTVRRIAEQRTSAEAQEGLAAFLDHRRPRWADPPSS
jgi:methylglutaconyl-CoA hydratase